MMNLKDKYIEARKDIWSPSTLKPTLCRLKLIGDEFLPTNPQGLYDNLTSQGYGAYTVKQVMLLATQVCKHGAPTKETFSKFMRDRRRLFTNAYETKRVPITFDEALVKINTMTAGSRDFALGLIVSGLRISEAAKVSDGQVIGKGNKKRTVVNADMVAADPGKGLQVFRRELKKATGLTPHQIRKLAATKLVELGAREADLCAIMGWDSFETAKIYIQATNVDALSAKLKGAVGA